MRAMRPCSFGCAISDQTRGPSTPRSSAAGSKNPSRGLSRSRRSAALVVTEGNYLLHWPEVRALLDEVWWVEVDESRRVRRLAARHERYGKSREAAAAWAHGPDEHNARLVAPGRDIADVIVRGH